MPGAPLSHLADERRSVRDVLTAGAVTAAVVVFGLLGGAWAEGLGLKPGLWEVRLVHQVVDGHDVSQQLTESIAKAQAALAHLPPEARARVQNMLNEARVDPGNNASFRICITPAMAASDLPVLDKDNHCRPTLLERHGNHTTFRIDCSTNGTRIRGQGDAMIAGDMITSQADVTTTATDGSVHSMHNETQMQYLSADCGDLHPPQ